MKAMKLIAATCAFAAIASFIVSHYEFSIIDHDPALNQKLMTDRALGVIATDFTVGSKRVIVTRK